jgi:hypothetical protein
MYIVVLDITISVYVRSHVHNCKKMCIFVLVMSKSIYVYICGEALNCKFVCVVITIADTEMYIFVFDMSMCFMSYMGCHVHNNFLPLSPLNCRWWKNIKLYICFIWVWYFETSLIVLKWLVHNNVNTFWNHYLYLKHDHAIMPHFLEWRKELVGYVVPTKPWFNPNKLSHFSESKKCVQTSLV